MEELSDELGTPVTGVIDANACNSEIYEEINNGTDLGWIEHRKECKGEECMHDVGGRVLIGSWRKTWVWRNHRGKELDRKPADPDVSATFKRVKVWAPDTTGEYAAMYNKDVYTIQVDWSKHTAFGQWCSPCYPGQASIPKAGDNTGFVLCYTLPPALLAPEPDYSEVLHGSSE